VNPGRFAGMTRRTLLLTAGALVAATAAFFLTRSYWTANDAAAQSRQNAVRTVPVITAIAEKKNVPVRVEALGNVTTIASVAIKPRVDSVITAVNFNDGARVKEGDLLFTLDGRQTEAEIKRVQAVIDGAQAQLEQAERDVQRYTDLVAKNATTLVTLNNAQTQVNIARATADSNRAMLENLKVQLDFTKIRAPITGRISQANVKVGNFVRQADALALATINQMSPVYVSFPVAQKVLPDVRQAISAETATVEATVPGDQRRSTGAVTMVENTVDPATGMVMIRATMPNKDEILWPGTLVTTELTLRVENTVVVPSTAVQVSQTGPFVFVVKDGAAVVQPIKVERTVDSQSVISSGLEGGETVVIDGQLLLSNGTKVTPRNAKAGA
jgi:multidrug efflux system membrane fusion protein